VRGICPGRGCRDGIGGSSDVIARSNIIENCNGSGIAVRASSNVILGSNIIKSCNCGIFLGGKSCLASGNQILNCNEGIRICKARYYFMIEDGFYNQIMNNLISDNRSKPIMTYAIYEDKSSVVTSSSPSSSFSISSALVPYFMSIKVEFSS